MTETAQGMQIFKRLWFGRFMLELGTSTLFYTLIFWIYLTTHSVTMLGLFFAGIGIPAMISAPLARSLVQRWNPRRSLALSHTGGLVALLVLFWLLWTGQIMPWHPHLAIAAIATVFSLRTPAYQKAIRTVVPEEQRDRATLMDNVANAISELTGQLAAGLLILTVGLSGAVAFNLVVFSLYLIGLLFIRIPDAPASSDQAVAPSSPLNDFRQGWRYIVSQPGLFALLIFFAITNIASTMVQIIIVPFGLTVAAAPLVGATLAFAGLGPLLSTLMIGRWGAPRRLIFGVLGFTFVQGLVLLLGGLRPSLWLIGLAAFVFLACYPYVLRSSHTIWEQKVPLDMQQRAFAVRRTIAWSTLPLAQLLVGPLADNVFNVNLAGNSGFGVLFMSLGILVIIAVIAGYAYPRLRLIEEEMPDVTNREKAVGAHLSSTNAY